MYEPDRNTAALNNSISGYIWGDIPTKEIDQAIRWLDGVKADCDHKIHQLKIVKRDRERSKAWRQKMETLVLDFMKDEYLGLSYEEMEQEVRRRNHNRHWITEAHIKHITKYAFRESQKRIKNNRNADIALKRRNGISVAKIAKEYDLSRQQVYDILKKT